MIWVTDSRKQRGRETELEAANYYRRTIWPKCIAQAASLPGRDLLKTPYFSVEIKARTKFNPMAWLAQSRKNSGPDIPIVLMRPVNYGPGSIGEWPVFMRNQDFVDLYRRAYGMELDGSSYRATESKGGEDSRTWTRVRVGSEPCNSGGEVFEAAMSTFLHLLGVEPGDYEIQVRRVTS